MELLEDLDFAEKLRKRLISKIMNIAIRCTYFIFCRRNKEWTDPNLMDFFFFLFCLVMKQSILHCLLVARCIIVI